MMIFKVRLAPPLMPASNLTYCYLEAL